MATIADKQVAKQTLHRVQLPNQSRETTSSYALGCVHKDRRDHTGLHSKTHPAQGTTNNHLMKCRRDPFKTVSTQRQNTDATTMSYVTWPPTRTWLCPHQDRKKTQQNVTTIGTPTQQSGTAEQPRRQPRCPLIDRQKIRSGEKLKGKPVKSGHKTSPCLVYSNAERWHVLQGSIKSMGVSRSYPPHFFHGLLFSPAYHSAHIV